MPELPEVETTVRGLNARVLKRTLINAWSDWKKMIKKPDSFEKFVRQIKGKKIINVWRRAKNVIFELSGGYSLLVHQKMTGHLMVGKWHLLGGKWRPNTKGPLQEKINTYIHFALKLDNKEMIALSDLRKFAKIELVKTEDLKNELKNLGPEPLEKNFTFKNFQALFKNKKGKVKQVIMNPAFIAGIGNIYACEALWEAKIHPAKDVSKLKGKELKLLYCAIKKVLKAGVKFGGDSFSDYRDVNGEKGKFEGYKKAYQREGQPCYRCKNQIARISFSGRSAFYCHKCQKL